MHELGQICVTNASVTLVIDDSDRAASPREYVYHAQKTVTRWCESPSFPTLSLCLAVPDSR
jgi:hypothetical protein